MKKIDNDLVKGMIPYVGLIVLVVVFSLTTGGRFTATRNLANIIGQSMVTMIAACGSVFVMAHNNLDFSLGGGCALIAALSFLATGGRNLFLTLAVCILLGVLCGMVTALIHVKGHIPAFMAGMCIMFVGRGVVEGIASNRVMNLPAASAKYADNRFYLFFIVLVFAVATLLFHFTKIGKAQKVIGSNPKTAMLSGIEVGKYKAIAFGISGATLGISAFLTMLRIGSVTKTIGSGLETDVLIALTLGGIPLTGGTGTKIRAAFVGTLTYYVLGNGLTIWGVGANMIYIVKSVIFLITVFITMDRNGQKYAL